MPVTGAFHTRICVWFSGRRMCKCDQRLLDKLFRMYLGSFASFDTFGSSVLEEVHTLLYIKDEKLESTVLDSTFI